jgi:membrane-bound lytic murein transglycosylase A
LKRRKPAHPGRIVLLAAIILALGAAARLWLLLRPVPATRLTVVAVRFDDLAGWTSSDANLALAAFRRSCAVLLREPPLQQMGGAGYAGRIGDWRQVCVAASAPGGGAENARAWFENRFAPFELRAGSARDALFTGYYEPEIAASRMEHGDYSTPIYGLPRDLVTVDLGLFRSDLSGVRITGRVANQRLVPLPARAEIDADGLDDAPVLLYARDPVAVFFLHIQGSGRVRFEDGSIMRVAYAGQNGHPYTPVGRTLIESGALDRAHMSMQAIRAWLETHPAQARRMMESDQSYVFFRELPLGNPSLGSPGSEGVPLTPQTSIAVDPGVHPLGVPMFLTAEAPAADPTQPSRFLAKLCIAQDTGGAIKGILRADIFWGYGTDAESIAGRMKSAGHLYVLLPKSLAGHVPAKLLEDR